MLIPRLVHIQNRKIATAKAGQLKVKSAATAPRWKMANATTLVQLSFRAPGMSIGRALTGSPHVSLYILKLTGIHQIDCNFCVISSQYRCQEHACKRTCGDRRE